MAPKPRITGDLILELMMRNPGWRPADVARQLGVDRQLVSYHLKAMGWESPAAVAARKLPWDSIPEDVKRNSDPYRRVRDHVLYMDTGGQGMSHHQLSRLRQWYEMLAENNEVLEYDPHIAPYHGQKYGHFVYRTRERRDHDLIIRENAYTKLSKAEKEDWRLPDRELWPAAEQTRE